MIRFMFQQYKRQIFRENLLPNFGGKIPDSAFISERLTLNRLQQNGLFSPGHGIIQQNPERHLEPKIYSNTLKFENMDFKRNVDTTYVIREPVKDFYFDPPMVSFYYLPITPRKSLQLRREYTGDLVKVPSEETQILLEFMPLLKRLHDTDYI